MTLRLPGHYPARIDAMLEDRETRANFIRAAIERELARRAARLITARRISHRARARPLFQPA